MQTTYFISGEALKAEISSCGHQCDANMSKTYFRGITLFVGRNSDGTWPILIHGAKNVRIQFKSNPLGHLLSLMERQAGNKKALPYHFVFVNSESSATEFLLAN